MAQHLHHVKQVMITNYLLLAWRNIQSRKLSAIINVMGISIAIATCITIYLFLNNYWNLDNFHPKGGRLFMLEYETELDGTSSIWGNAPRPLAKVLAEGFPQVEQVVRLELENVEVYHQQQHIGELLTYADTNFFEVFNFPLRYGSPQALRDPNAVVLNHDVAEKYFPGENPIGRTMSWVNDSKEQVTMTVQGVAAPFPDNTGLKFALMTGYHPTHTALKNSSWADFSRGLLVLLRQPTDTAYLSQQLQPYIAQLNAQNPDLGAKRFLFDNLVSPNAGAYDVNRRVTEASHPMVTIMYTFVGLLMLALACFNYINITLGGMVYRLREIGVRKAMGGSRGQIIAQFLTENLLLVGISMLLGLVLAQAVFIPLQNGMMTIKTHFDMAGQPRVWLFLMGLWAFTGLVSGAYPALYVSRFNATAIFSGKQKFGGRTALRRGLLAAQFVLVFVAVISSIVLILAGGEFRKISWGYDPSQTLVLSLTDSTQYGRLRNELAALPEVEVVASTVNHLGLGAARQPITVGGVLQETSCYQIGEGYPQAMGIPLLEGRHLQRTDADAVLVNEKFVEKQGWTTPIGQRVRMDQKDYNVVGVLGNVKMIGTGASSAVVFLPSDDARANYLLARYRSGAGSKVAQVAEQHSALLFGGVPVQHFFQKDVYENFDQSFDNVAKNIGFMAIFVLLIACAGLYGLAMQHYAQRLKEVSIRKMLGARLGQIAFLVNREFAALLLLAGGVATAICLGGFYVAISALRDYLGNYSPSLWSFFVANVLVLSAAAITVGYQTWRMAHLQIANHLKDN